MARVKSNLMKAILWSLLLTVCTCFFSQAKDLSDNLVRPCVPDVLVVKMLLFGEMISKNIPETKSLHWPDASAKLTVEEIRLAKSINDKLNKNNIFYRIETIKFLTTSTDSYWISTYREFDKNSGNATGGLVSTMWYKSPSVGWHLAEISNPGSGISPK
jgi:hypothetical protein